MNLGPMWRGEPWKPKPMKPAPPGPPPLVLEDLGNGAWRLGEVVLDLGRRRVTWGGRRWDLTLLEHSLLEALVAAGGRAVSAGALLAHAEGLGVSDFARDRAKDPARGQVCRLRRKIGADVILTVRGHGYRLNC